MIGRATLPPRLKDYISFSCATCGGRPEVGSRISASREAVEITALCHGKTEVVLVDCPTFSMYGADSIPRRWFLRNWAGYTIKPAPGMGRRL